MSNWQIRAGKGGVCDFKENFDFYFKWLTDKVMSCFIIQDNTDSNITNTINWDYFKLNLILDGSICITDFSNQLYACIGNRGGEPNEYYLPTIFTIANPILGSKQVKIGETGIVIYNTKVDCYSYTGNNDIFNCGLYDLISQTATLLADNIISINCAQINSRITTFFTADSEAQALAGEAVLKKQYAGKPYQVVRSDLIDKFTINPVNSASGNITELVELHNYIIANFFQSIGVKSNNIMKRERLINSEIDSQNDYLKISLLEILSSWQDGLDEVNKLYNTDIRVTLNPAILDELLEDSTSEEKVNGDAFINDEPETEINTESTEEQTIQNSDGEGESNDSDGTDITEESSQEPEPETIEKKIEEVNEIVDIINDEVEETSETDNVEDEETDKEVEEDEEDSETS